MKAILNACLPPLYRPTGCELLALAMESSSSKNRIHGAAERAFTIPQPTSQSINNEKQQIDTLNQYWCQELETQGQGQGQGLDVQGWGLENWSSRILEYKDFPLVVT